MTERSSCETDIGYVARCLLDSECPCMKEQVTSEAPRKCSIRKLAARQHLFHQGEVQKHVYRVRRGAIRVYKPFDNGRRQLFGLAFPGDLLCLEGRNDFRASGQAIVETEVCCVSQRDILAFAASDAKFAFALYEIVSKSLIASQVLAFMMGSRNPEASVAAFLLMLYHRNKDVATIDLPLLRSDIADYLGLTLETVSRVFTRFRQRKLIELKQDRTILLTDLQGLALTAEFDELASMNDDQPSGFALSRWAT